MSCSRCAWQRNAAAPSASAKAIDAFELLDGLAGIAETVGGGGAVASTVTAGCAPWNVNAVVSRKSDDVQTYVASEEGAVALKEIPNVPPGQSSLGAPGGATASIVDVAALNVTVQLAATQLPEADVPADRVAPSITNPPVTIR